LLIRGEKTRDNIVEDYEFSRHTFDKDNAGAHIRIGNSSQNHKKLLDVTSMA